LIAENALLFTVPENVVNVTHYRSVFCNLGCVAIWEWTKHLWI